MEEEEEKLEEERDGYDNIREDEKRKRGAPNIWVQIKANTKTEFAYMCQILSAPKIYTFNLTGSKSFVCRSGDENSQPP